MTFRWYKIPLYVLLGVAFAAGLGYITMALWNVLIPELFQGPLLTFWQTIGLLILIKIFLFSISRRSHSSWYDWSSRRTYWRKRFEEKMKSMSPEDREKFKEEWKRRCGPHYWNSNYHHHGDEKTGNDRTD